VLTGICLSDNKGYGKILIIVGIVSMLFGFGVGVYGAVSSLPSDGVSMLPPDGNVTAATFIIIGIALTVLGLWKL